MVDVGQKPVTQRLARASAVVVMKNATGELIRNRGIQKGNVLESGRLAAIMGCKQTAHLIPMCHPLSIDSVEIRMEFSGSPDPEREHLRIESIVRCTGKTGVEMEALTSVSIAALTIYDMCKSVDREMEIGPIRLEEKLGGKSGHFVRRND